MKKLICMLLALVMCMSVAFAEEIETKVPGTKLGFEVLRELADGSGNKILSPLSLTYAMAMAAQGAKGETQQQMLDALDIETPDEAAALQEILAEAGLKQANAAFVAGEMTPEDAYVEALEEMFGAKWFDADGNVAQQVNDWVGEVTDGMIDRLLEEELSEDIMLVLVNAIAMEAKWAVPFSAEATYDDVFHTPEGDVTVPFMHNEFWADYGERDGVQLMKLSYQDSGLSLMIALPEEGGVEGVLDALCEVGLDYFAFDENAARVKLAMPKVDLTDSSTLNDALKAMGVETAFSDAANFSGISSDMALKIDSVLQKARLIFDEEGTRAAAATAMMIATMSMINPADIVEFNMNRPFVFAIADESTGAVCFSGVIANPAGN